VQNRAEILMFCAAKFCGEGVTEISEFYKSGSPTNVAKFDDDQPRDLRDQTAKNRKKKDDLNYSSK